MLVYLLQRGLPHLVTYTLLLVRSVRTSTQQATREN
jgi:hypothetical protein